MKSMRRVVAVLFALAAVTTTPASATHGPVVRASGQIGLFRIDGTTEPQLRAVLGKPSRVENDLSPGRRRPIGHTLYYRCGGTCQTGYSFNNATGKLSDFWTRSPHFRTERGSYVGMRRMRAVALERKRVLPGCGIGPGVIYVRSDRGRIFVLGIYRDRIYSMTYLGPHSVYYDGLC